MRRLIGLVLAFAFLAGGLALSAGAASASTYPGSQPGTYQTSTYTQPAAYVPPGTYPQPNQFRGCTSYDRQLLIRLLVRQRLGYYLTRSQRTELYYLQRLCGNPFIYPVLYSQYNTAGLY